MIRVWITHIRIFLELLVRRLDTKSCKLSAFIDWLTGWELWNFTGWNYKFIQFTASSVVNHLCIEVRLCLSAIYANKITRIAYITRIQLIKAKLTNCASMKQMANTHVIYVGKHQKNVLSMFPCLIIMIMSHPAILMNKMPNAFYNILIRMNPIKSKGL